MHLEKIFVLYEERENSQSCGIRGAYATKEQAMLHMRKLIEVNKLYTVISQINVEDGWAESDPMYNEEQYSNYYIQELTLH